MALLMMLLFSTAFLLAGLAVAGLAGGSTGALVARRLRASSAGEPGGPGAVRQALREGLLAVGGRLVSSRGNLDALREALTQAGYRSTMALPAYFGARTVLMAAAAFVVFALLPAAGLPVRASFLVLPYAVLPAWLLPRLWLRQRVRARQKAIQRALPDMLDLLVVCVEAGLGLNQALVRVAAEIRQGSPEMAAELRMLNLEVQAGATRAEAFRSLGSRTGVQDVQALATMLIQADRFGTSIGQALRVQAESLRTRRRQRAEEEAAKTTIKLVFPLVFFIFPALFVVILGPALVSVLKAMS